MSNYLHVLLCRIFGHPAYRRARKGENPDMKYCVRCRAQRLIHKRKLDQTTKKESSNGA